MGTITIVGTVCVGVITASCIGFWKEHPNLSDPMAAVINGDLARLQSLESAGTDLNAQYPNRFNWTVLMAAIYFQRFDIVTNLIDHKVDIRKRDASGKTALMWAIEFEDTNTVALLTDRSPQALREGEDWTEIAAEIECDPHPERWHKLLDSFLKGNNIRPSQH